MRKTAVGVVAFCVILACGTTLGAAVFALMLLIVSQGVSPIVTASALAVGALMVSVSFLNLGWQFALIHIAQGKVPGYGFNVLCGTVEKCSERMRRECELARNLGYVAGSNDVSERHLQSACERFERELAVRRDRRERTDH